MSDLVTVVIPVFNGARYLREAIQSIQSQCYHSLEIVVVDDGSTDESLSIAKSIPGVRCLQQRRGGPAAARNAGVCETNGQYLAFLDADDLWTEGKMKAQMDVLARMPDVHMVAGHVEEFYSQDISRSTSRDSRQSGQRAYTVGALLLRRADFLRAGYFNPDLKFGEFIDWRSRALNSGLKEHVLDKVVLRRRIHGSNTTMTAKDFKAGYLAAIRAHIQRKGAQ